MRIEAASAEVLALLAQRETGKTVCPSEVARRIALYHGADWRVSMPLVHAAVDRLLDRGSIELSWKGSVLAARSGPYRIGRAGDSL